MILVNESKDLRTELRNLFTAATVRDAMCARWGWRHHKGHVPRRGNVLVWLITRKVGSTRLYFAAWAPRGKHVWSAMNMLNTRTFPGWKTLYFGQFGE